MCDTRVTLVATKRQSGMMVNTFKVILLGNSAHDYWPVIHLLHTTPVVTNITIIHEIMHRVQALESDRFCNT